jgi:putative mRNA 3-end processing factor
MQEAGLIQLSSKGLYCAEGDFFIDPWYPAGRAIITHGHSDHARIGQSAYLAHPTTCSVMKHRLGEVNTQALNYEQELMINGVGVTLFPAGHIPGSAQVRIRKGKETWVVSGDYKCHADGLSEPFVPVTCNHFISECTFGLPVFHWQPQEEVMASINHWWRQNAAQGLQSVIFAYALGKAQRILNGLDPSIGKIFGHGAVIAMNQTLHAAGVNLAACQAVNQASKEDLKGAIIIAPPAASGTPWLNKFEPYRTAFASGWMAMRGSRRWQAADRGFVLSDHADWKELNNAVESSGAENIYLTHGYKAVFAKYLQSKGKRAFELDTLFEGESLNHLSEKELEANV